MRPSKVGLIFETIIKSSLVVVLIIAATTKQEYSYYTFVRWFVAIASVYFAYRYYERKQIGLITYFCATAVLFNPIIKIWFQKEIWHIIDYLTAGIMVATIIYDWATITSGTSSSMAEETPITELSKVIRRLELIKNLIILEDERDINEQVSRLQQLDINDSVRMIVNLIQEKAYGKAVKAIELFINSNNQIAIHIDPEIEALRLEAKILERQLQELSDEKAELEKLIHEFSVRHSQELGELIIKILKYRRERSKGTPQEAEAEKDYENFQATYETTKDEKIVSLTEEQQKELKSKYRKASKLCHPDVVEASQQQEAHKIFIELNSAYEKNDLKRVTEILERLEQGKAFISKADAANEKLTIQIEIERLRALLNDLQNEIHIIKSSETYEKIKHITDWDDYFAQTKEQLQEQLIELEGGKK